MTTLLDLCECIVDCEHKTAPISPEGYPSIRTPNVGRGRLILDGVNRVNEETYKQWTRRATPRHRDLIIAREAPVGNVAMILEDQQVCLGQRTVLVRPDPHKVHPEYLAYFMLGDYVQGQFQSASTGATVPHLNVRDIRRLAIPELPPLPTQRRIASILSAYDDLIENNTRRIAILEEMARRLYEEWFVKLRFPGHERRSEDGELTDGWEGKTLGDLVSDIRATVHPSDVAKDTPYVGLEHIPRRSITLREWSTAEAVDSSKLRFQHGDIMFGKIRPYFHKVCVAPIDGICSTDTILLRPRNPKYASLAVCCASSDPFVDHAVQTSNGTKMPRADWKVLKEYPVFLPPPEILGLFNETVEKLIASTQNLARKNANLRTQRDLLLPKLVSGEIDVSEAEDLAEETAA